MMAPIFPSHSDLSLTPQLSHSQRRPAILCSTVGTQQAFPDVWVSFLCLLYWTSITISATNNTNCYLTLLYIKSPNQSLQMKVEVLVTRVPSVRPQEEPIFLVSVIPRTTTLLGSKVPPSIHLHPQPHLLFICPIWASVLTWGHPDGPYAFQSIPQPSV